MTIKSVTVVKKGFPRQEEILKWAEEKGIFENGTQFSQFGKLEEEVEELLEGIEQRDRDLKRDAIGDVCVVLTIMAKMAGLTMEECVEQAWSEIKDRKGTMRKGVFVKEG